ncbi:hypothetical protein NLM16_09040 [Bradyrhizobium brasilense]|uniref:hypothetical protein n=1 Tax=Bradyrhizobium brasilense TaxID=1419277 RepID=UPI002877C1A2|nr:hypothetical protein [Bradyrhizobium brasilense]MCP3414244.1 hypothetical protein [Bradyrhizobium brasilense]
MAKAKKAKSKTKHNSTKKKAAKKAKKAVKKAAKKSATAMASSAALGCCNIIYDDSSEKVEGVTKDRCRRLGIARGGTGQWSPGRCQ